MKFLRWKHYGYISASVALLLVSLFGVISSLNVARANVSQVTITQPGVGEQLSQRNQVIEGTAPASKELVVFDGKTRLGTTNSNSEGDWSFTWESPTPGEHSLRAVLVDGSYYRSTPYNKSAVQKVGVNTGEVEQNYSAGLSWVTALAYNSNSDDYFAVNAQTGTITVIDGTTKQTTDTVSYGPELDERIANSYGSGCGTYAPLEIPDNLCPSLYDEQNNKFYFLEVSSNLSTGQLYVFDTSTNEIDATIDLTEDYAGTATLNYKLYQDPQKENLYIYHTEPSDKTGDTAKTFKINLGSNTLDGSWSFPAYNIVSKNDESLYYVQVDGTLAYWDSGTQLSTELDIAGAGCVSGGITQLAIDTSTNTALAECRGSNKLILVDTTTNNLSSEDADAQFINSGNLENSRLFLLGNASILDYNTSSASFGPEISGYTGYVLPQGSGGFYLSGIIYDSQSENLYIPTTTYDEGTSTYGSNIYVVDTNSGNPTYNQITDTFTEADSELLFASKSIIGANNEIASLSLFDQNTIHTINTSTGARGKIRQGLGSGYNVQRSDVTNELFSVPVSFGTTAVHISDAAGVDDDSYIDLPGPHLSLGSIMSGSGNTLYVLAYPLFNGNDISIGDLVVYKIDTQTKQIEEALTAFSDIELDFFSLFTLNITGFIGVYTATDDDFYVTTGGNLYQLDTNTDTKSSTQLVETPGNAIPIAVSPDGSKVAASVSGTEVSIRSAETLAQISNVDVADFNVSDPGMSFTSTLFVDNDTVLISYPSISSLTSFLVNANTGDRQKTIQHSIDVPVNFSACIPLKGSSLVQVKYIAVTGICFSASEETGYYYQSFSSFLDIDAGIGIFDSDYSYIAITPEQADSELGLVLLGQIGFVSHNGNIEFEVLSTTQDVTVIADDVSIIKPKEAAKLSPGEYTITGTAPPEKTVTVLVDGKSIGNTQSDEYGAWSKKHTFVGGETKVRATTKTQDRGKAYFHYFSLDSAGVVAVNTLTNSVEDEFSVPSPYISTASFVSQDNKTVLVGGFSPETGDVALFRYSVADDSLTKTTVADIDIADLDTSSAVIDSNEDYAYIATDDSVLKINIETGNLTTEYELGAGYTAGNSGSNTRPKPVLVEDTNLLVAVRKDCHGLVYLNLETEEVTTPDIPESVCIGGVVYSEEAQQIYSSVSFEDGDATIFSVSATNINTFEQDWVVNLEGYLGFSPSMLLSEDRERLYLQGSKVQGGNNFFISPVEISTDTGAVTDYSFQPTGSTISKVFNAVTDVTTVLTNLAEDSTTSRLFGLVGNFEKTGDVVGSYTRGGESYDLISGYEDKIFFGNLGSNFIATVPGETLQDTHNIQVIASTATPPPTTIITPTIPAITETPTSQNPDATTQADTEARSGATQTVANQVAERQPSSLQIFVRRMFAAVKRFVSRVPVPLVNAFPYILFMLLAGLIGYYLYQTQKQLRREERLRSLYEKQRVLAEEKRNFLELTSHYLRTPLTYIKAGSEMILRNKKNEQLETELSEAVGHLGLFVESLIEEASNNESVKNIDLPETKVWSPLLQKSFWMPVAGFAAALGLFYIVFGMIGGVNFGPARYVTQLVLMFVVIQLFYGMFKNHHNIVNEEQLLTKTVNSEESLDHARSKLMHDAGEQLSARTEHLAGTIEKFESSDTSKNIMKQGVDRLRELAQAFMLVSSLENDMVEGKTDKVSVRTIAAEVIEPLAEKLRAKKVNVEVSGFDTDIELTTNRPLAELTLKSLLENALQASKEGSSLIVKCLHKEGRVAFQVIDHGAGIPKDKIERLFKPFVRVGPVTTFNREGIGLSLYLDRLIMHALGGEVEVVSRFKHGTTATVTFNQKSAP